MTPHRFLALIAIGLVGCNSAPVSSAKVVKAKAAPAEELADTIHETLQKSSDLAACRRLVEQLNVALARPGAALKPDPLPADLKVTYAKELGLTPQEIEEIARGEFTPLDAAALEEAFLFRELAKALDVAALAPIDRARAALDWVARNVRELTGSGLATPPVYVVMRGTGTPLERTYVFLAILTQLELDAALVGDPAGQPAGIWGVAVSTDDGVFVFDARLGLPLPGPKGGVATLSQARNDPAVLESLADKGSKPAYDVSADRIRASQVFIAEPLSMLAPRLRFLQGLLPSGAGRISSDVVALRERFQKSLQGAGNEGIEVKFWSSPAADAWPRALMSFLPPNDGGSDRGEAGQPRRDRYHFEQVPWKTLPPHLLQLSGEPGDKIRSSFAARVLTLRQAGQARDLMIRGLFRE